MKVAVAGPGLRPWPCLSWPSLCSSDSSTLIPTPCMARKPTGISVSCDRGLGEEYPGWGQSIREGHFKVCFEPYPEEKGPIACLEGPASFTSHPSLSPVK